MGNFSWKQIEALFRRAVDAVRGWPRGRRIAAAAALAAVAVLGVAALALRDGEETYWAQGALDRWSSFGAAHEDPEGALTLGEAADLFSGLLGLGGDGSEAAAVEGCLRAGVLDTEMLGDIRDGDPVSRELFFTMVCRALRLEPSREESLKTARFQDFGQVSPWARDAVTALVERDYVQGVTARQLHPEGMLSRAGALSLLDQALTVWVTADHALVRAREGVVLVAAHDVTLTGAAEQVVVAEGARDSSVTLEDLSVRELVSLGTGATAILTGETYIKRLRVEAPAEGARVYIGESALIADLVLDNPMTFVAGLHEQGGPDAAAAESAPPEETPGTESAPPEETPGAETDPPEETPGAETDPPEETPGAETDPPEETPGAESDPPEETPGAESDPPEAPEAAGETGGEPDGEPGGEPGSGSEIPSGEPDPAQSGERDAPPEGATPEGTVEGSGAAEEPEPDLPPELRAVRRARLVDYVTGETPYETYEVRPSFAAPGENHDILVELVMTGLRPNQSRGAGAGWWTGFAVAAPEGAMRVTAEYSYDGMNYGVPYTTGISEGAYSHFFDAARWNEYYVRLSWSGPGVSEADGASRVYKLDFRGVELDLSGLTAEDSPLGKFGVAGLRDTTGGAAHKEKLFDSYGITLESRRDRSEAYLELTVQVEGLVSHRTAAGTGKWAGFSVAAPYGAESFKYSVYLNPENARRNFGQKSPVTWENFSENVDGMGSYGVVQRSDASKADQRNYWAVLQWFLDEEGTVPLTAPEILHVRIEAT